MAGTVVRTGGLVVANTGTQAGIRCVTVIGGCGGTGRIRLQGDQIVFHFTIAHLAFRPQATGNGTAEAGITVADGNTSWHIDGLRAGSHGQIQAGEDLLVGIIEIAIAVVVDPAVQHAGRTGDGDIQIRRLPIDEGRWQHHAILVISIKTNTRLHATRAGIIGIGGHILLGAGTIGIDAGAQPGRCAWLQVTGATIVKGGGVIAGTGTRTAIGGIPVISREVTVVHRHRATDIGVVAGNQIQPIGGGRGTVVLAGGREADDLHRNGDGGCGAIVQQAQITGQILTGQRTAGSRIIRIADCDAAMQGHIGRQGIGQGRCGAFHRAVIGHGNHPVEGLMQLYAVRAGRLAHLQIHTAQHGGGFRLGVVACQ